LYASGRPGGSIRLPVVDSMAVVAFNQAARRRDSPGALLFYTKVL
jgi:hypothetical protein